MTSFEKTQNDIRHTLLRIIGGRGAAMIVGGTALYYLPDGLQIQSPPTNLGVFQDVSWGIKIWLNRVVVASDNGSQYFRLGETDVNKIYQGNYLSTIVGYSAFDEKWLRITPFAEGGIRSISSQGGMIYNSLSVGGGIEVSQAIPLGYYATPKVDDIVTTWLLTLSLRSSYLADYFVRTQTWDGGFINVRFNIGIGLQSDMIQMESP
ncbi:MAG: hypothetical protein MUF71_12510 [Candidatus Kapabacteria bacterium]|jgi:hypothetical protein|nr:hypothetical protein [Candidatus Kapabacteria bacterium]